MPSTETVKKTLIGLLELRDLDRELERLRRRCRECPRIIGKHKRDYESEGALVERKKGEIGELKRRIHGLEVDLRSREENINKLSAQLLRAKTNQEYTAFQDQIKRISLEKNDLETNILEAMDGLESLERELSEAEKENKAREDEFNELRTSLEADLAAYSREMEELERKRSEMLYSLDPEAVKSYERVLNALGGDAVVSLENRICSGCYMTVTSNDYVRVCAMKEIVHCKSCQRILYLPELLGKKT